MPDFLLEYLPYLTTSVDGLNFVSTLFADDRFIGAIIYIFLAVTIIALFVYFWSALNQLGQIDKLNKLIGVASTEGQLYEQFDAINKQVSELRQKAPSVVTAWFEYGETLVRDPENPPNQKIWNTVRPHEFFNPTDLGFTRGFWQHLPSIFVSIGLLLTFFGIISALNALNTFDDESMRLFLQSARAKFLMSLSGLAASVVFTVIYKWVEWRKVRSSDKLCDTIEALVLFKTPAELADLQLTELKQQSQQLQALGNNMGAQIGSVVAESLSQQLSPVLDRVGNSAGDSVGGMVRELGDALNSKLNDSLDEMSKTLSTINTSLISVSEKLTDSTGDIGSEVTTAIQSINAAASEMAQQASERERGSRERLQLEQDATKEHMNQILKSIEENTRSNASQLNEAAKQLGDAVADLTKSVISTGESLSVAAQDELNKVGGTVAATLDTVSGSISDKFNDSAEHLLSGLSQFERAINGSLVGPVESLAKGLDHTNAAVEQNALAIEKAAAATAQSSQQLQENASSMANVALPIANATKQIESVYTQFGKAVDHMVEAMRAAEAANQTSAHNVRTVMAELEQLIGRVDTIDDKLGAAMSEILEKNRQVSDQVTQHANEVTNIFSKGVNSLKEAVGSLEDFKPASES